MLVIVTFTPKFFKVCCSFIAVSCRCCLESPALFAAFVRRSAGGNTYGRSGGICSADTLSPDAAGADVVCPAFSPMPDTAFVSAGDTAADASCGSFSCTFGAAASHAFSGPAALPHDSFCSCADAVLHGSSGSAALLHGSFCSCEAVVLHGSSGSVATSHDASAGAVFQDAPCAVSVSGVHADMFCEASGVTAASASSENADGVRFSAGGYPPSDVRGTIFSSRTSGISR